MAPLDKSYFAGSRNLQAAEIKSVKVNNFAVDVETCLAAQGGNRETGYACVSLFLSPDNQLVEGGTLIVRGPVDGKQLTVEADKIWPNADKRATLLIKLSDGSVFSFSDGGLASDIVAREGIEYSMVAVAEGRQPAPILEANYEEWGFGGFALRMLCNLSKKSSAKGGIVLKYTILLFPMDKSTLLEKYELAQSPAWPGIRLAEGHIPLLPRPQAEWGCPVLPLLRLSDDSEDGIDSGMLRNAVAHIMRRATIPETGRSGPSVMAKWEKLSNNPEEMREQTGDVTWPEPSQAVTNTGKLKI